MVKISNEQIAAKLCALLLRHADELNESAAEVKDACPEPEFEAYREVVGRVMGWSYTDILEPLWLQHPSLAPTWFSEMMASRMKPKPEDA